ncbi:MAG: hypothetical protein H6741_05870 [Alphaproteobacteria bacterium]|nr:hypothetical protein [Alphaproteobacteria bacterium]MCB9792235.1 hypothetical protein [Alphaproteobacteria bacterium]
MHNALRLTPLLALLACGEKDGSTDDSAPVDSEAPEVEALSDFESGQFRVDLMAIVEDQSDGEDVDGDGEPENKLPGALVVAALLVDEGLQVTALNGTLAQQLADEDVVLLNELTHVEAVLTFDVLLGLLDEAGTLSVDPASLVNGEPQSRATGAFSSQTEFSTQSERVVLPFPLLPEDPEDPEASRLVNIPLELVTIHGAVDAGVVEGRLSGAIPIEDFINDVVERLVPTGDDYDPEAYGMTREELFELVWSTTNQPGFADVELGDGRLAVSAVLEFHATQDSW